MTREIDGVDVARDRLKLALALVEQNDTNYDMRERMVYYAMGHAKRLGFKCGFRLDPSEPNWPVAYIELPTGQVSWHMPQHSETYDGHSTEEKYRRVRAWIDDGRG